MIDKTSIRPQIPNLIQHEMSEEEIFQNKTLRPILKMQHPLFIAIFKNYFVKQKNRFYQISDQEKEKYVLHITSRDHKFRNKLLGLVMGHFTEEEYQNYEIYESALNRRIITMLQKRILDSLEAFEQ